MMCGCHDLGSCKCEILIYQENESQYNFFPYKANTHTSLCEVQLLLFLTLPKNILVQNLLFKINHQSAADTAHFSQAELIISDNINYIAFITSLLYLLLGGTHLHNTSEH